MFSLDASGGETFRLEGTVFVLPTQAGAYGESPAGSGVATRDVTPLLLTASTPFDLSGPYLSVGLLSPLGVGRYVVRRSGRPWRGDQAFYADFVVPEEGGWSRHYFIDGGTIVIDREPPFLRGSFTLHAGGMTRLPSESVVGSQAVAVPADLTLSGVIGR